VTRVYTPKPEALGEIASLRLTEAGVDEQLDVMMEYYRRQRPLTPVICWSLDPPQPPDLGERLIARGFHWHGRPCWMWLDLRRMETNHRRPSDLQIEVIEDERVDKDAPAAVVAVTRTRPRRVWRFAASLRGQPVGQSWLHRTTGRLGVAGLYAVHVDPEARNQGVGKVVSLAACQFAQALGCRYAVLNATDMGEPVYRRLGFAATGAGQTWWLDRETLAGQG
jgi:GNAT superfamily N-acetyltransferase